MTWAEKLKIREKETMKCSGQLYFSKWIKLQYKFAKLASLLPASVLPSENKRWLSTYEDLGFRSAFYRSLWQKSASKLGVEFIELGHGYWQMTEPNKGTVRGNMTSIDVDRQIVVLLCGNKPLVHQLLIKVPGYKAPAYQEFRIETLHDAIDFMYRTPSQCVVKPANDTGAGFGVTTGIETESALCKAAISASVFSRNLMIEESITGKSYRLLILNGKLIHAVRRDPPIVVGNGKKTIRQLIVAKNERRMSSSEILALYPIQIDQDCKQTLAHAKMKLKTVPNDGDIIKVKYVVNQNAAEQNIEVTSTVHPFIEETAIESTKKLGLVLAGVDVITEDISLPLDASGGVINEINGNPGLHHHYLTSATEKPNIAEELIKYCLAYNQINMNA